MIFLLKKYSSSNELHGDYTIIYHKEELPAERRNEHRFFYIERHFGILLITDVPRNYLSKRLQSHFGEKSIGASFQWDAVFADGDLYKSGRTGQGLYVSSETDTVIVWFSSA